MNQLQVGFSNTASRTGCCLCADTWHDPGIGYCIEHTDDDGDHGWVCDVCASDLAPHLLALVRLGNNIGGWQDTDPLIDPNLPRADFLIILRARVDHLIADLISHRENEMIQKVLNDGDDGISRSLGELQDKEIRERSKAERLDTRLRHHSYGERQRDGFDDVLSDLMAELNS